MQSTLKCLLKHAAQTGCIKPCWPSAVFSLTVDFCRFRDRQVIDPVEDYLKLIRSIFDFGSIKVCFCWGSSLGFPGV